MGCLARSLVLSSVVFSAMHHLPPYGDPLVLGPFVFRVLAAFSLAFSSGGADSRSLSTPTPFTTSSCSSSDRAATPAGFGLLATCAFWRRLLAAGFLAADFLAAGFLAADFLAGRLFGGRLFGGRLLAAGFLAAGFLAAGFWQPASWRLALRRPAAWRLAASRSPLARAIGCYNTTLARRLSWRLSRGRCGLGWRRQFLALDLVPVAGLLGTALDGSPSSSAANGTLGCPCDCNQDASRVRKGDLHLALRNNLRDEAFAELWMGYESGFRDSLRELVRLASFSPCLAKNSSQVCFFIMRATRRDGSGTSSSASPRGFLNECTSPHGLHWTRRISSSYFEMTT